MLRYILQRILITIPLLFSVAVLSFLLIDLIPGSAARVMLQDAATPENIAILEERMGLNDPIWQRFGRWLGRAAVGDFGTSVLTERPVMEMLLERIQPTLSIAIGGMILGIILGLLGGIFAGLYPGSLLDRGDYDYHRFLCWGAWFFVRDHSNHLLFPQTGLVPGHRLRSN